MKPDWKIMQGDVRKQLALIPENSIQCVITSPPYYGLRDYGLPTSIWGGDKNCDHEWLKAPPRRARNEFDVVNKKSKQITNKGSYHNLRETDICQKCGAWKGCLGLEPTPEMYVNNMVEVFRGVRRVLRDNGIFWLNLGDSYAGSGKAGSNPEYQKKHTQFGQRERKEKMGMPMPTKSIGYKPKDLMMIPFLVARALQQDGWYLRSVIPWLKNSAMPESVLDRPSSAIEYFFLLSKSQKYFYDIEVIKPKIMSATLSRAKSKNTGLLRKDKGSAKLQGGLTPEQQDKYYSDITQYSGRNRRNSDWFMDSILDILEGKSGTLLHDENGLQTAVFCNPQPYPEAHFATFSPRLITPMILAGTSPRACEVCGAPWERVVAKTDNRHWTERGNYNSPKMQALKATGFRNDGGGGFECRNVKTIGWQPTCTCKENSGKGRCIVLDPFAGSGTTLEAARKQGRDSIGIELSGKYCKQIKNRMKKFRLSLF